MNFKRILVLNFSPMEPKRVMCRIRRRFFLLTPEEEVRQAILNYLIDNREFPQGLFSVENTIKVNGKDKRTDILVHDKDGGPLMIVECKAPKVTLDQKTVSQIAAYNSVLDAPYLMMSNGLENHMFKLNSEEKTMKPLDSVPFYKDL